MPIEGFDYKAFANDLSSQAMEILSQPVTNAAPDELTEKDKKSIVSTVQNFCLMAGEALSNDASINFNADQASLVTQFIGEWTYHKSIDLINGKVPEENRGPVLQQIAANIFNTAKLAIIKKMPQDALINLVEEKVNNVYRDELQKLLKKGILNQEQFENAVNKSNLKEMVEKTEEEAKLMNAQSTPEIKDKKVLKLASLAIVLKKIPQEKADMILKSLNQEDVVHILNYMKMSNLEDKIDHRIILNSLEEIKRIIPLEGSADSEKLLRRYYKLIKQTPVDKLSKISLGERENVKDFILDIEFPSKEVFSQYVIQSLVNSVEEKIHDN